MLGPECLCLCFCVVLLRCGTAYLHPLQLAVQALAHGTVAHLLIAFDTVTEQHDFFGIFFHNTSSLWPRGIARRCGWFSFCRGKVRVAGVNGQGQLPRKVRSSPFFRTLRAVLPITLCNWRLKRGGSDGRSGRCGILLFRTSLLENRGGVSPQESPVRSGWRGLFRMIASAFPAGGRRVSEKISMFAWSRAGGA